MIKSVTKNVKTPPPAQPSPHDPFLSPHWRWERARWLRQERKGAQGEELYVRLAWFYLGERQRARHGPSWQRLEQGWPGIHWAYELYQQTPADKRWALEAYLLTGCRPQVIAQALHTTVEVVVWYEKLFFNVWPYLRHPVYIVNTVMRNCIHHGMTEHDYDLFWKMVGYTMGPKALEEVLLPLRPMWVKEAHDVDAAFMQQISSQTVRKVLLGARTIPVWGNQEILFNTYQKAQELEKSQETGTLPGRLTSPMVSLHIGAGPDRENVELRAYELIDCQPPPKDIVWELPPEKTNGQSEDIQSNGKAHLAGH